MRDAKGKFCKAVRRPFKVGDRVVISREGHRKYAVGLSNPRGVGGVIDRCPDDSGWIGVMWDNGCHNAYRFPADLELAPASNSPLTTAIWERDEAREEVERLKGELEKVKAKEEKSWYDCNGLRIDRDLQKMRASAAEAKLADIAALIRVDQLMSQQPGDVTLDGMISTVLDRE